MNIVEGQLFVAKSKDTVFAEPTLDQPMKETVLTEWKTMSLTVAQWREKFEIVKKVSMEGTNVEVKTVREEEFKMESSMDYKNPPKRRVRESLEDEDLDGYVNI